MLISPAPCTQVVISIMRKTKSNVLKEKVKLTEVDSVDTTKPLEEEVDRLR